MYFSHVLHEEHDGGDAQAVSVVHRRRGEFTLTQTPAAKHAAPGCGGLPWRIWRRVGEKTPSLSLTYPSDQRTLTATDYWRPMLWA